MSPETAAALLELCAIIEGWPGAPALRKMQKLKAELDSIAHPVFKKPCTCGVCQECDWARNNE